MTVNRIVIDISDLKKKVVVSVKNQRIKNSNPKTKSTFFGGTINKTGAGFFGNATTTKWAQDLFRKGLDKIIQKTFKKNADVFSAVIDNPKRVENGALAFVRQSYVQYFRNKKNSKNRIKEKGFNRAGIDTAQLLKSFETDIVDK